MDYFLNYISQFFTNSKEISFLNQNNIYDKNVLKNLKLKVNTPRGQGLLIDSKDGIMKIQFRNNLGNEWYEHFPETSISPINMLETPLQIINDIKLWEEILYTYFDENFLEDHIYWTYFQVDFPNGTQQWIQIDNDLLRFNLRTLKPCKKSKLQKELDKDLIKRIQNNAAYQKFFSHKIKFDNGSAFDLGGMKKYLKHHFDIDYDTMENDIEFQKLSQENRVKMIKTKHNNILNNCQGLILNTTIQDIFNPE